MRRKYDYHIHFQLKFVFINMNTKNQIKAVGRGHEKGEGSRGCAEKNMQAQGKAAMAVPLPPSGNSELMPSDCDVLCHALRLGKCSDCAWHRLVKVYARRQREE